MYWNQFKLFLQFIYTTLFVFQNLFSNFFLPFFSQLHTLPLPTFSILPCLKNFTHMHNILSSFFISIFQHPTHILYFNIIPFLKLPWSSTCDIFLLYLRAVFVSYGMFFFSLLCIHFICVVYLSKYRIVSCLMTLR